MNSLKGNHRGTLHGDKIHAAHEFEFLVQETRGI